MNGDGPCRRLSRLQQRNRYPVPVHDGQPYQKLLVFDAATGGMDMRLICNGYWNLRRFAGGLQEWQQAGYRLEGEMVDARGDRPGT